MKLKSALIALGASALVVAPVAAQAGTAASASVGKVASLSSVGARQTSSVEKKQKAGSGVWLLAALGAAAAGFGIYKAVDDDNTASGGA